MAILDQPMVDFGIHGVVLLTMPIVVKITHMDYS
jgi:hypothetical protein